MKQKKEYYQNLNYNDYTWSGFWNGLHHFIKQDGIRYKCINCTEEMLVNGDIKYMAEHDLTYKP